VTAVMLLTAAAMEVLLTATELSTPIMFSTSMLRLWTTHVPIATGPTGPPGRASGCQHVNRVTNHPAGRLAVGGRSGLTRICRQ
jgi:hypothetical protein